MLAVVQRVKGASVSVNHKIVSEIGLGLMVLLGIAEDDTEADAIYLADKIVNLRIFGDENDKMNRSLTDVSGEMLVVSQFTLIANTRKGRRPSFNEAAKPSQAIPLYLKFQQECRQHVKVEEGIFQAKMMVKINNDGPVTLIVDSLNRNGNKPQI